MTAPCKSCGVAYETTKELIAHIEGHLWEIRNQTAGVVGT